MQSKMNEIIDAVKCSKSLRCYTPNLWW